MLLSEVLSHTIRTWLGCVESVLIFARLRYGSLSES